MFISCYNFHGLWKWKAFFLLQVVFNLQQVVVTCLAFVLFRYGHLLCTSFSSFSSLVLQQIPLKVQTYKQTNIQTDKQTRQTNKQTDNQTNRQISFESTNRSKENNLRYPIWDLTRYISQIFLFLKLSDQFSVGKELIGPTFVCRKACKLVNPATASSELSRTHSYSDLYFNSIQVQFNPSWHVKQSQKKQKLSG